MNEKPAKLKSETAQELLLLARDGDVDALQALLEPYWNTLYRLAFRVMGNTDDAEDLAQETILRILQRLPTFRGECDFGTWVYRIGLNACLTARKRHRENANIDLLSLHDRTPGPEAAILDQELQERARSEIERLRPAYREAVLLRLVGGLSYEAAAEVLNVSANTVRLRVSRGMRRLRERLSPWAEGREDV